MVLIGLFSVQSALAKSGGVDYSWGADALALMHDYVVTMMLYVLYLGYAIAAHSGCDSKSSDIHKNEYRRRGSNERDTLSGRCLYLHDRCLHRISFLLWVSDIKTLDCAERVKTVY